MSSQAPNPAEEIERIEGDLFDVLSLAHLIKMAAEGMRQGEFLDDSVGLAFSAAARVIEQKVQNAHYLMADIETRQAALAPAPQ